LSTPHRPVVAANAGRSRHRQHSYESTPTGLSAKSTPVRPDFERLVTLRRFNRWLIARIPGIPASASRFEPTKHRPSAPHQPARTKAVQTNLLLNRKAARPLVFPAANDGGTGPGTRQVHVKVPQSSAKRQQTLIAPSNRFLVSTSCPRMVAMLLQTCPMFRACGRAFQEENRPLISLAVALADCPKVNSNVVRCVVDAPNHRQAAMLSSRLRFSERETDSPQHQLDVFREPFIVAQSA